MSQLLWCECCERVYCEEDWTRSGRFGSYGVCPTSLCGSRGHKHAKKWEIVAKQHGFPINPVIGEVYHVQKLF